ncbi:hypothetical protein [Kushneria aurantia]|uniref:Uncharacterized protein n=1 Tax=Kushneria aurantia TaxID=504092 RepID=A0ABV6G4I8_9GAMM|nr:hypothetical protein [Kushneria aurantia]
MWDFGAAASSAADAAGSLFNNLGDYSVKAFDWLESNPQAANVLGGVMAGVGNYYAQKDQQNYERRLYREKRRDQMINPGAIEGYGSHIGEQKKGLLSNGIISGGGA